LRLKWKPSTTRSWSSFFAIWLEQKASTATRSAGLPVISMWPRARGIRWDRGESPEQADMGSAHYLMTPWHALQLALGAEQRALAFYVSIAGTATDAKIKTLAEEFVEEEAEHVNLVHRLLRKYPKPGESWSEDPDPPVSPE
jgi:hypothetical protein